MYGQRGTFEEVGDLMTREQIAPEEDLTDKEWGEETPDKDEEAQAIVVTSSEWYVRDEVARLDKEIKALRYILENLQKGVQQICQYNTELRDALAKRG